MLNHDRVEAPPMRWLKRDAWKIGSIITGMLFLFVLMTWLPLSAASAHEGTLEVATSGSITVQATPTEDATVTALNKEKLAQEVQQLENQNEPNFFGWLQANAALLSTLLVVIGGLVGLWRWLADRRSEREKRAEERFQAAVAGLGDDKEGARIGAAILLRTFLRPGYEQFYTQTFDLAVANLRLPRTSTPPTDPTTPLPLTTLSQALIVVFKEAFPLARNQKQTGTQGLDASLDASGIQLDNAYLSGAGLKHVWMPEASLRKASLRLANLSGAYLNGADLSGVDLRFATLSEAYFRETKLREANLSRANLSSTDLSDSDLTGADLRNADLSNSDLTGANLSNANLREVNLREANLQGANLNGINLSGTDLSWTDLSGAYLIGTSLSGAYLSGATLSGADLMGADLTGADLTGADLTGAKYMMADLDKADLDRTMLRSDDLSLSRDNFRRALRESREVALNWAKSDRNYLSPVHVNGSKLEDAPLLKNTDLRRVKGLTKEQLAACKAKGAIIGEDPTTDSSQSTVSPPLLSQSNDMQAPSASHAQGSAPTSDPDGSSAVSTRQEPEP